MSKSKLDNARDAIKNARTIAELKAAVADLAPADRNKLARDLAMAMNALVGN